MKRTLRYLLVALLGISFASCDLFGPKDTGSASDSISESVSTQLSASQSQKQSDSTTTSHTESASQSQKQSASDTISNSESVSESVSESASSSDTGSASDTVSIIPTQDGIIELTNSIEMNSSKTITSLSYGDIDFELYDTNKSESGFISLSKGGYLLNTTAIGDIDSFKVEYSLETPSSPLDQDDYGFGSLYYVTDTHAITSPRSYKRVEVTNNELITLSDNPNYIAFYTFNEIDIKSITINYDADASYVETFSNFEMPIFATNDIHGQVNPDDKHAGLENVAGYIEENKQKYNLLLDQGDIYQGSLACYLTEGHIMDDFLLMNGYDSTILGNHEWDWMEPNILEHRDYSPEVKLLACNVRYKDGSTPSWVRNYYTVSRGGVKFGVIGALGDIAGDISADMIENINFVTGDELTDMLVQYSDELLVQGCDYIILQIHAGSNYNGALSEATDPEYTEVDYSQLEDKLDLVLESHSHKGYYHQDQYGITHMQCGGYLSHVGKLTLQVTFNDNKPSVSIKRYDFVPASKLMNKSSTLFGEVNKWYSENVYKEESEKVVATSTKDFDEKEIDQLAANAYYALKDVYPELSQYTVSVGGGHINCRSPKKITKGDVTMSDIANLFPFDNELYLVKINGRDLKYQFLKTTNWLAGDLDASSTTNFKNDYYIILDSYNYFFLTKQLTNPISLTIEVNLTALYNIHPRDAFAMYFGKEYPIKDGGEVEITNTGIDFAESSTTFNVKDGVSVTANYSNVADNATYSQFNVLKNNGIMTFTCTEGYVITDIEIKQYSGYANLKYYSDTDCSNELTYTIPSGVGSKDPATYTLTNNTSTFVVKNTSNYDLKLFYIKITVEKVQ